MALYVGNQKVCPVIKVATTTNNQDKTITANGVYMADTGYTGLGEVTVNVPTSQGIVIVSDGSSNTGFSLKSLEVKDITAYQYMFNKFYIFGDTITSLDFSSINNISGAQAFAYAFQLCTGITTALFTNLQTLTGAGVFYFAFRRCTALQTIYFNSLTSNSFGTSTNQFQSMLDGVTSCTVHFPSNLQSVIGNWTDVQSGFGGTNTTILFDLEATE